MMIKPWHYAHDDRLWGLFFSSSLCCVQVQKQLVMLTYEYMHIARGVDVEAIIGSEGGVEYHTQIDFTSIQLVNPYKQLRQSYKTVNITKWHGMLNKYYIRC